MMNAPNNPLQLLPQWANINDVQERILETNQFIIFINAEGNCDYMTSDDYDKSGPKDPGKHGRLMSEATHIEQLSHGFLSATDKIAFKKLIGEGIARSFEHEYIAAKAAFQNARNYLERRQNRQSRVWYMSAAVVVTAILGIPFWAYVALTLEKGLSPMVQTIQYIEYGLLGALFSIMWRMGKTAFDSDAERNVHYWEAFVRIIGGGIAALIIMFAVKAKILFANFVTPENEVYSLGFICVAAGMLEKWAPSLIASAGKQKVDISDSKD
jgi:ABC-type Fe3+-siderophore transport system permease subunit